MTWISRNWRWAALNLFGLAVLAVILREVAYPTPVNPDFDQTSVPGFDPLLESGKWAVRFLLICLAMTPLNTLFGWRSAIKLRKPAGLWAFGFAGLHLALYLDSITIRAVLLELTRAHLTMGAVGITILALLAVTSNRWSMQKLGKNWKRLHRLVYAACGVTIVHGILGAAVSKRMSFRDPTAVDELEVYLGVLAVLLVVRIPLVRRLVARIKHLRVGGLLQRGGAVPIDAQPDDGSPMREIPQPIEAPEIDDWRIDDLLPRDDEPEDELMPVP